ncbi:MAG: hypothetical protein ACJA1R_002708 [Flavobacteriales bacterium]|jgi:hypothetical protein
MNQGLTDRGDDWPRQHLGGIAAHRRPSAQRPSDEG